MKLHQIATLAVCLALTACGSSDKKKEKAPEKPVAAAPAPVTIDVAWLDRYEAQLRDAVKGSSFAVERRGDLLVVVAPEKGTFNPDRPSMLLPVTLAPITRMAKLVEADEQAAVMIFGHADSSGDAKANRTLSGERAGAFAAIFRLSGLKHERLLVQGVGADQPRASNDNQQGRADNRRVEMVFGPLSGFDLLLAQYQAPPSAAEPEPAAQLAKAEASEKPKK